MAIPLIVYVGGVAVLAVAKIVNDYYATKGDSSLPSDNSFPSPPPPEAIIDLEKDVSKSTLPIPTPQVTSIDLLEFTVNGISYTIVKRYKREYLSMMQFIHDAGVWMITCPVSSSTTNSIAVYSSPSQTPITLKINQSKEEIYRIAANWLLNESTTKRSDNIESYLDIHLVMGGDEVSGYADNIKDFLETCQRCQDQISIVRTDQRKVIHNITVYTGLRESLTDPLKNYVDMIRKTKGGKVAFNYKALYKVDSTLPCDDIQPYSSASVGLEVYYPHLLLNLNQIAGELLPFTELSSSIDNIKKSSDLQTISLVFGNFALLLGLNGPLVPPLKKTNMPAMLDLETKSTIKVDYKDYQTDTVIDTIGAYFKQDSKTGPARGRLLSQLDDIPTGHQRGALGFVNNLRLMFLGSHIIWPLIQEGVSRILSHIPLGSNGNILPQEYLFSDLVTATTSVIRRDANGRLVDNNGFNLDSYNSPSSLQGGRPYTESELFRLYLDRAPFYGLPLGITETAQPLNLNTNGLFNILTCINESDPIESFNNRVHGDAQPSTINSLQERNNILVYMNHSNTLTEIEKKQNEYVHTIDETEAKDRLIELIRSLIKELLRSNREFLGITEVNEDVFILEHLSLFTDLNNDIDNLIEIPHNPPVEENLEQEKRVLVEDIVKQAKNALQNLRDARSKWLETNTITKVIIPEVMKSADHEDIKVEYYEGESFSIGWEIETSRIKVLRNRESESLEIVFGFKADENLEFSLIEDTNDISYLNHPEDAIRGIRTFNSVRNLEIKTNKGIYNIKDVEKISKKMDELIKHVNQLGPDINQEGPGDKFIKQIKVWAENNELIIKESKNAGEDIYIRSFRSPAYRPQVTCKVPISKIPDLFQLIFTDTEDESLGRFIEVMRGNYKIELNIEEIKQQLKKNENLIKEKNIKIKDIQNEEQKNQQEKELKKLKLNYFQLSIIRAESILSRVLKDVKIKEKSAQGLFYLFIYYTIRLFNGCIHVVAHEQGMKAYLGIMSRYSFYQMYSNLSSDSKIEFKMSVENLIEKLEDDKNFAIDFRMVSYYDYGWGLVDPEVLTMKSFYESFVMDNGFHGKKGVALAALLAQNKTPFYDNIKNKAPRHANIGYGIDETKKEWDSLRSQKGQVKDIVSPPPYMGFEYSMGLYKLGEREENALIEFRLYAELPKSKNNFDVYNLINNLAKKLFSNKDFLEN